MLRGDEAVPDLSGETWLITGATRGLGLATATLAARRGARLVLAVRDVARGAEVARGLGGADVVRLDLASLRSVREAAGQVGEVDVIVNNAGGSPVTRTETEDGFEWHLGVNALAPLLFTNLLLDRVRRRVVVVASLAHRFGPFDFDDPHFRHRRYRRSTAYGQSKLADLLWAAELARRLEARGSTVDVQCSHPGWSFTRVGNPMRTRLGSALLTPVASKLANPVEQGALTTLFAATQELPSCSLIGPDGPLQLRGRPTIVGRSRDAADPAIARRFWDFAIGETGRV